MQSKKNFYFDEKSSEINDYDCCACTACESICPVKAIKMHRNKEGFLYPQITSATCIDCQLCKKVCPIQKPVCISKQLAEPLVYAVKHKEIKIRMSSSSGGAYVAISDYALNLSYNIYGVKFDDNFFVEHGKAVNKEERDKFKGSKYVQSDLKDVFLQINEDLKNGKGVLFTGTGCQVAGLVNYLKYTKVNTDKLITNDIVCKGVPSPLVWRNYLEFIQKKRTLKAYSFRYKEEGWHGINVSAEFLDGKQKINTALVKIYANLFSSNLLLRKSCYKCKFTNLSRCSDITMGDFWGIERTIPEMDDNKGVSLIIINTPKGKSVFDNIKNNMDFCKSNTNDCYQPKLKNPTVEPELRIEFWDDYFKYGFEYISKKYGGYNFKSILKYILRLILEKTNLYNSVKNSHIIRLSKYK